VLHSGRLVQQDFTDVLMRAQIHCLVDDDVTSPSFTESFAAHQTFHVKAQAFIRGSRVTGAVNFENLF